MSPGRRLAHVVVLLAFLAGGVGASLLFGHAFPDSDLPFLVLSDGNPRATTAAELSWTTPVLAPAVAAGGFVWAATVRGRPAEAAAWYVLLLAGAFGLLAFSVVAALPLMVVARYGIPVLVVWQAFHATPNPPESRPMMLAQTLTPLLGLLLVVALWDVTLVGLVIALAALVVAAVTLGVRGIRAAVA